MFQTIGKWLVYNSEKTLHDIHHTNDLPALTVLYTLLEQFCEMILGILVISKTKVTILNMIYELCRQPRFL